jgi:hypothetical protein
MLNDALLLAVALALIIFSVHDFLTTDRRKFATADLRAATLAVMGFFIFYFAWDFSKGKSSSSGYYPGR